MSNENIISVIEESPEVTIFSVRLTDVVREQYPDLAQKLDRGVFHVDETELKIHLLNGSEKFDERLLSLLTHPKDKDTKLKVRNVYPTLDNGWEVIFTGPNKEFSDFKTKNIPVKFSIVSFGMLDGFTKFGAMVLHTEHVREDEDDDEIGLIRDATNQFFIPYTEHGPKDRCIGVKTHEVLRLEIQDSELLTDVVSRIFFSGLQHGRSYYNQPETRLTIHVGGEAYEELMASACDVMGVSKHESAEERVTIFESMRKDPMVFPYRKPTTCDSFKKYSSPSEGIIIDLLDTAYSWYEKENEAKTFVFGPNCSVREDMSKLKIHTLKAGRIKNQEGESMTWYEYSCGDTKIFKLV